MQHPEASMQITWNLQHALAEVRYANDYNFSADRDLVRLWRLLKELFKVWRFRRFQVRQLCFSCSFFKRRPVMSRREQRSAFDHVSEFDRGSIVTYRDCGLSFSEIGSLVGRNQTTIMRVCDLWMHEGTTDRRSP
ncbi:uncharacterized protein TNCV_2047121 [Trichonephila clavipes]|uniref:Uncharacterized protein n=1 Tax=Trichonephila clavipes TaxID=2585209 RepID=A0A8X6T1Q3_TRICX|nr:uncharacterized protein TNCV_2047121 [Trichonephila clavipes]